MKLKLPELLIFVFSVILMFLSWKQVYNSKQWNDEKEKIEQSLNQISGELAQFDTSSGSVIQEITSKLQATKTELTDLQEFRKSSKQQSIIVFICGIGMMISLILKKMQNQRVHSIAGSARSE